MKIKFEPNLQFQKEAIDSVVRLFDGAPFIRPEDRIMQEVSPNILNIDQAKHIFICVPLSSYTKHTV